MQKTRTNRGGFSLLELIIVVIIIGIIAAIAIPRMSRGSTGAADSALAGSLAVLREAIDRYAAEHGGAFPASGTAAEQLTQYTTHTGAVSATKDTTYNLGPYLQKVPPLSVGARRNNTGIASADGATVGWIYSAATGVITPNTTASETDVQGRKYSDY